MNQYHVEYYSNDSSKWLKCSITFESVDDAMQSMREQAVRDPDLAHRLIYNYIRTKRKTIALSAWGEEIIKLTEEILDEQ